MPTVAFWRRAWRNYRQAILVSLLLAMAGLVATKPEWVVPIKSYLLGRLVPIVPTIESLGPERTATALPDGASTEATPPANGTEAVTKQPPPPVPGSLSPGSAELNALLTAKNLPPDMLRIPQLKLVVPVIYVSAATDKAFQQGLQQGVVHYPGTALPGQAGNSYIFGHSSDYRWSKGRYKTIFATLPQLKPGAEIHLTDRQGKLYTYIATSTVVARVNEVKYLSQQGYQKKLLTLQTSWPVGTALKRWLVLAELRGS